MRKLESSVQLDILNQDKKTPTQANRKHSKRFSNFKNGKFSDQNKRDNTLQKKKSRIKSEKKSRRDWFYKFIKSLDDKLKQIKIKLND